MAASLQSKQHLSELVAELPQRYTASNRIQDFPTQKSKQLIQTWSDAPQPALIKLGLENKTIINQNQTDGLRWTFDDKSIVHLRPSRNAPELRFYTEAGKEQQANDILTKTLESLTGLLSKD